MKDETMNVRREIREKARADEWFDALTPQEIGTLGDDLVLSTFDWRDWGFEHKPSSVFMRQVDYRRILWEMTE